MEGIALNEMSLIEKGKKFHDFMYMWNLKNKINNNNNNNNNNKSRNKLIDNRIF